MLRVRVECGFHYMAEWLSAQGQITCFTFFGGGGVII